MKFFISSLFLIFSGLIFSKDTNADDLLNQIKDKLNKVNDYSVDLEVSINMDFIKMPKSKAQLFFKKPDKMKFNSTGFAILPKAGVDFNPQKILEFDLTSAIIGDTLIDSETLKIVQITPKADSLKFKSAIMFIDDSKMLIKQINLVADYGAKIETSFKYNGEIDFALPSEIKINIDISEIDENEGKKNKRSKMPNNFKGDILIKYSNYKVNLGIDDSVFEEEKEEKKQTQEKTNK